MENHAIPNILIVDDETSIIRSISRLLRNEGFAVVGAESPQEALKRMRVTDFHLVISDLQMPGMDGIEFLSLVAEIYPKTARILISGVADKQDLKEAIDQCQVEHFIQKPWDPKQLKAQTIQVVAENEYKRNREIANLAYDKLEEDASLLQRSLLPQAITSSTLNCEYILPSNDDLRGDGLGFHLLNNKLNFYQFCVSDQGLTSVMQAQTMHAKLSRGDYSDPAQLLLELNRDYPFLQDPMRYVTLICGCLDVQSGELLISCAGHPGPTLLGDQILSVAGGGLPIGLVENPGYFNTELDMSAGDKLVIFSAEVADEDDADLINLLNHYKTTRVSFLKLALQGWRTTRSVSDDIAVLLIERN